MSNKLTVADIDTKHLSANTLAFLFPESSLVVTPGGGLHLYLIGGTSSRKGISPGWLHDLLGAQRAEGGTSLDGVCPPPIA